MLFRARPDRVTESTDLREFRFDIARYRVVQPALLAPMSAVFQ
jgi:hypothetical protein